MEDSKKNRILECFKKDVLKLDNNDNSETISFGLNASLLKYALVLSVIIDLVLIINNIITQGLSMFYLLTTLTRITFALVLLFLTIYRQKISFNLFSVFQLAYYVVIITTTTALQIDWNKSASLINTDIRIYGLSAYYIHLFIIVFFEVRKKIGNIILTSLLIISCFVPFFFTGRDMYPFIEQLILRVYLFAVFLAVRTINKNLLKSSQANKVLNDDLIKVSYTDALTCAMNKRALYKYIEYLSFNPDIDYIGSCIFDIDDFKSYNDHYSHLKGDAALEKISEIAIKILDEEGAYLFRYGGEEFTFFLLNPTKEKLLDIALKIKNEVYNSNIERDDTKYKRITITLGCSLEETVRRNDAEYILIADKELYVGKNTDKNCVVLDNEIHR